MTENVSKWVVGLVLALLVGPVSSFVLGVYMYSFIEEYGMDPRTYSDLALGMKLFAMVPGGVVSALWIRSVCRREKIKALWWCVFGLFFQVLAVAVFFASLAFQRLKAVEAKLGMSEDDSQDPEEANQPPQPTGHSAVRYDPRLS